MPIRAIGDRPPRVSPKAFGGLLNTAMLPDLLKPGLNVVICGTGAGAHSAAVGHYYAGRGNRFWRTLAEVGPTAELLTADRFERLLEFGIGLTDLVKMASGSDRDLARRVRR